MAWSQPLENEKHAHLHCVWYIISPVGPRTMLRTLVCGETSPVLIARRPQLSPREGLRLQVGHGVLSQRSPAAQGVRVYVQWVVRGWEDGEAPRTPACFGWKRPSQWSAESGSSRPRMGWLWRAILSQRGCSRATFSELYQMG